jgi:hypothetical protein
MSQRYFYAQVDEHGKVIGVSDLSGPVSEPHMLPLGGFDQNLLGQVWDDELQEFREL